MMHSLHPTVLLSSFQQYLPIILSNISPILSLFTLASKSAVKHKLSVYIYIKQLQHLFIIISRIKRQLLLQHCFLKTLTHLQPALKCI